MTFPKIRRHYGGYASHQESEFFEHQLSYLTKDSTAGLPLDFLGEGSFEMTEWADGENSGEEPTELSKTTQSESKASVVKINLAKNGGFSATIKSVQPSL